LRLKIYEIKYNISLNDVHTYRINVSKKANNISTLGDDSTAAGCSSRLITVLVQHAHYIVSVTLVSCFRYEGFAVWALPKMIVLILVFW